MKKNILSLFAICAFMVTVTFYSIPDAEASWEPNMCNYHGYFRSDGSFSCAIGSLPCSAPCANQA